MILSSDLQKTLDCLEGIVNSAVHPKIAVRAVMVDLKPIRKEIARLKLVMAHNSGADYPIDETPIPETNE
jgi:hypothetical protein